MAIEYCDRSRTTGQPHPKDHGFCPLLICTDCGESERYHWTDCVCYKLENGVPTVFFACPVCAELETLDVEIKSLLS